jgi:hypothetical protein
MIETFLMPVMTGGNGRSERHRAQTRNTTLALIVRGETMFMNSHHCALDKRAKLTTRTSRPVDDTNGQGVHEVLAPEALVQLPKPLADGVRPPSLVLGVAAMAALVVLEPALAAPAKADRNKKVEVRDFE